MPLSKSLAALAFEGEVRDAKRKARMLESVRREKEQRKTEREGEREKSRKS